MRNAITKMNFSASETSYSPSNLHDYKSDSELHIEIEQARSSKRYAVALLICLGSLNMFFMRSNMTIAVVDMMSNKTVTIGNQTKIIGPAVSWDSKTRGIVLSLFYYGHLTAPVAGYVASKFGGVRSYGYGILVTAILTLMTPFNLRLNFYWFAFCRVIEGVAEAVSATSIMDIASKWARPEERSKFMGFGLTGIYIGTTVSFPLCGYLAHTYGWPAIFYGTGTIALFWTLLWFLVLPSEHDVDKRRCSYTSVNSIKSLKLDYPWKQILTCKSIWALNAIRIAYGAGYSFIVLALPLYLKDATDENIHNIGLLTAIPNFISIFTIPLSGWLIDYLVNRNIFTTTQIHKIYACASLSLSGVILVSITFTSKLHFIILLLVFFKILLSFALIVIHLMPVCVAPQFSSVIYGIATFWYTVTMIVSPIYVGFIVDHHTIAQWNICFVSMAIVMITGALIFLIYASSETQPWAIMQNDRHEEDADTELKTL